MITFDLSSCVGPPRELPSTTLLSKRDVISFVFFLRVKHQVGSVTPSNKFAFNAAADGVLESFQSRGLSITKRSITRLVHTLFRYFDSSLVLLSLTNNVRYIWSILRFYMTARHTFKIRGTNFNENFKLWSVCGGLQIPELEWKIPA